MNKSIILLALVLCCLPKLSDAENLTILSDKDWKEPKTIIPSKKGKAPSDAIVLFNGKNLNNFESIANGGEAPWKVNGNKVTVVPGTDNIQTKQHFGDCQLHIEWRSPRKPLAKGKSGQGWGNSGIYLMGKYELQVLNSYQNETDFDRMAGAIYKQYPPLVNASLKPGKWQTYDIIFTAPRWNDDNTLKTAGRLTVFHNGVLIQNNIEIQGSTRAHSTQYPITKTELPLMLQHHKCEVSYRNIWIREL